MRNLRENIIYGIKRRVFLKSIVVHNSASSIEREVHSRVLIVDAERLLCDRECDADDLQREDDSSSAVRRAAPPQTTANSRCAGLLRHSTGTAMYIPFLCTLDYIPGPVPWRSRGSPLAGYN